jgi:hypothetical protein
MGIKADVQLASTKSRLSSATPAPDFLKHQEGMENSSTNAGMSSTQVTELLPHIGYKGVPDMPKPLFPRKYRTKRQYRLIYEEAGQPLYAARNLRSTFEALNDTLNGMFIVPYYTAIINALFVALTLLYLAGYVHRDISVGNIIMIENPNGTTRIRGKLSDFEYAKEFRDGEPSPDPKTVSSCL